MLAKVQRPYSVLTTPVAGRAVLTALLCSLAAAQSPPQPSSEIQTQAAPFTFSSKVSLVSVPVVARDAQGHAVGSIPREDFQIFDNGKPQTISRFSVEKFGSETQTIAPVTPNSAPVTLPDHYVAYLFDDAHITADHLAQTRAAAWRRISSSVNSNERVAIYTTTGQIGLDFTSDLDKIHKALDAIRPQSAIVHLSGDCPPLTIFMADLLWNKKDPQVIADSETDVRACTQEPMSDDEADFRAQNAAKMVLALADRYIRESLDTLDLLIKKMSMMAGQRTVVMVSDGYFMLDDRRQDEQYVFENALHSNIVINTLDARALYSLVPGQDASSHTLTLDTLTDKKVWADQEAIANRSLLAETAANTGGSFAEGNDLDAGMTRASEAPEYVYIIGFNPENLKSDGKYHNLKVEIHNVKGLAIEARHGYYAPRYSQDSVQRTKEEISEAFFSREEIHDIPAVMQTQFFKSSDYKATVSVIAKVDVRQLQFRKEGDRNANDLVVVSGLFDQDGNYVTGTQKTVQLRLLDSTLQNKLGNGLSVKTTFDVAPGSYLVRMVVRDSESKEMAAVNGAIQIP
ncbi:MAG TPA: VWA domain-containing protein [Bryobacteraceae bacterium]|nr:VWA domain-containing protein [Bryobacteraceae bacterium]